MDYIIVKPRVAFFLARWLENISSTPYIVVDETQRINLEWDKETKLKLTAGKHLLLFGIDSKFPKKDIKATEAVYEHNISPEITTPNYLLIKNGFTIHSPFDFFLNGKEIPSKSLVGIYD